jgi:hypothetical protein
LDDGASVDLGYVGDIPRFKFATLESFVPSTPNPVLGFRDWDAVAVTVSFPISRFVYSAFFPDELGLEVLGVRAGRSSIDYAESARLRREGFVTQRRTTQDGFAGIELTLDMPRPQLKWTYRLCWRPPTQTEVGQPSQTEAV